MKTLDKINLAAVWHKPHRLISLTVGLVVAVGTLAGWYYVNAAKQVDRSVAQPVVQTLPKSVKPLQSSPPASVTTIQSVTNSDSSTPATTKVEVDGQQIDSPPTGSVHKVIQNPNGTTTVDISSDNSSSGSSSTSSSTHVNLNSRSTTEIKSSSNQTSQ